MQVVRKLMVGVLALFVAASSWAQVQQARGKASVTYAGKAATAEDKARALAAAQLKAVELHYAEAGEPLQPFGRDRNPENRPYAQWLSRDRQAGRPGWMART